MACGGIGKRLYSQHGIGGGLATLMDDQRQDGAGPAGGSEAEHRKVRRAFTTQGGAIGEKRPDEPTASGPPALKGKGLGFIVAAWIACGGD
ncbi:MAG: hypothetical protein VYC34_09110 [Planctomycetota bacterium]|nr:hypothetical protein [Planctomycetota bacterium]